MIKFDAFARGRQLGLALSSILVLSLAACSASVAPTAPPVEPTPAAEPTAAIGMPNPASVYCQEQGGQLEIRTAADGSQTGYCLFADGSECEEWAFMRGECAPGQTAATPAPTAQPGVPPPAAPTEELSAALLASLPAGAFEGVAVLPLLAPADSQPLWAAYSYGMRNWELDPLPSHVVAIYTYGAGLGWQELARFDLDTPMPDQEFGAGPDYVGQDTVTQAPIEPTNTWVQVEGGVGAHGGTYHLLRFDGQTLRPEIIGSAVSPGLGILADVNGDGALDVALNESDRYIFCYACGVSKPYFQVYTWLGDQMVEVRIADLLMGQQGQPYYEPNGQAVALAEAGLWADALAKIGEARQLAGDFDPPSAAGTLSWNEALIKLYHDANLAAIQESAYPLLNTVFYGDYNGAVNLMRGYSVAEIFSPDTPLIAGTPAEGWEDSLSNHIIDSATAALSLKPELASAYFLRGWAEFLANPADPQVRADLARAAELAPDDPLFAEAAQLQPGPAPTVQAGTPPIRIQFPPGGTAAREGGVLLADSVQRYVLTALAGQTMDVAVWSPGNDVLLGISGADGQVLKHSAVDGPAWRGVLPATQDYFIDVVATGSGAPYQLTVTIPPLGQ